VSGVAVCSSSGGKDSLLAMWHAQRGGMRLRTVLTMFDETGERSRSHGVTRDLMQRQANALGLELLAPSASWAGYEGVFTAALRELRATGHDTAVFGDIDLAPHREWEERVCAAAGLTPSLPLWHRNRDELAREVLAVGFRSVVVCVDSRHLGDEFCGREYDATFVADLPRGVDACGENGEFHTFVYDGPMFREPVPVRVVAREPYVAPAQLGAVRYCFARLESAA
jgi:diphthine-ammonia ligase